MSSQAELMIDRMVDEKHGGRRYEADDKDDKDDNKTDPADKAAKLAKNIAKETEGADDPEKKMAMIKELEKCVGQMKKETEKRIK